MHVAAYLSVAQQPSTNIARLLGMYVIGLQTLFAILISASRRRGFHMRWPANKTQQALLYPA